MAIDLEPARLNSLSGVVNVNATSRAIHAFPLTIMSTPIPDLASPALELTAGELSCSSTVAIADV